MNENDYKKLERFATKVLIKQLLTVDIIVLIPPILAVFYIWIDYYYFFIPSSINPELDLSFTHAQNGIISIGIFFLSLLMIMISHILNRLPNLPWKENTLMKLKENISQSTLDFIILKIKGPITTNAILNLIENHNRHIEKLKIDSKIKYQKNILADVKK